MFVQEKIVEMFNYYFSFIGLFAALALVWISLSWLAVNRNVVWNLLRRKKQKLKFEKTQYFLNKAKDVIFGVIIVLLSFALVNTSISGTPSDVGAALPSYEDNPSTFLEMFWRLDFTGLIAAILFILAGVFYIFSAFGTWLKHIARFLIIFAPAYLITQVIHAILLAGQA